MSIGKLGVFMREVNGEYVAAAAAIALLPARQTLPGTMMNFTRRLNVKAVSPSIISISRSLAAVYAMASKKSFILLSLLLLLPLIHTPFMTSSCRLGI